MSDCAVAESRMAAGACFVTSSRYAGSFIHGPGHVENVHQMLCASPTGLKTSVIGVPKTIDGDLKNLDVNISFGFDTACKVGPSSICGFQKFFEPSRR